MSAVVLRDIGQALHAGNASIGDASPRRSRRAEAEVAIREIQVLRADVDLLLPEAAEPSEHLVEAYRGAVTSGDHLRLPQMTSLDGLSMRAAITRVLAVDTSRTPGRASDVIKEEKMRRVLRALDAAVADIQRQSSSHS